MLHSLMSQGRTSEAYLAKKWLQKAAQVTNSLTMMMVKAPQKTIARTNEIVNLQLSRTLMKIPETNHNVLTKISQPQ